MTDPLTCDMRNEDAPDGTSIPIPVGGLGLPDGGSATIREDAEVQILENHDERGGLLGYYVVINNIEESDSEASSLFGHLAQEASINEIEHLATTAFGKGLSIAFQAAGLVLGVIGSLFTDSHLTREVFIRCDLDTGDATDGPPVTYCLLLAS